MLARTGLRASELCELAADAVTQIGGAHWLRVPVGKLRNDRFIPLHPDLVVLLAEWTATNAEHIRRQRRLIADEHAPIERRTVHRIVATTARKAGIGHVHPHQLRHTLATQAKPSPSPSAFNPPAGSWPEPRVARMRSTGLRCSR
ncbi:MAG: tyrosine-type recombinase/integrase [Actinobacteria bacterium]|nr:tyrosine-type recombinase/integrase [Actinomycetota bacterium]